MHSRALLAGACAFVAVCGAHAQTAPIPRIGVISMGMAPTSPPLQAFRQGLREHGYVDGQNVRLEYRFAEGYQERLPRLAAELVALRPSIIVTEGTPTVLAVNQATKTIPIVMAFGSDPVRFGLVASLARPGGNITGVIGTGAQRSMKQLQLLKESVPAMARVAVVYTPRPDTKEVLQEVNDAARTLGVAVKLVAVRNPDELDKAFEEVAGARPDGMITIGHGMLFNERKRIVDFALKNRMPGAFPEREFVEAGGLLAYGPDLAANFRRAAGYVDKILKGAKPGDLPVEQPTKWGLAINLRTAKALGLKLPASVLARADDVIQ
jgi:putative tryptophan/tyrosine transport system substrate-binding protein